jgi:hypothetical protein
LWNLERNFKEGDRCQAKGEALATVANIKFCAVSLGANQSLGEDSPLSFETGSI